MPPLVFLKYFFLQKVTVETESKHIQSRLPDGIFSKQKSQFGSILEGLGMENVGIYYGHLGYMYYV
jgi:hypothetical protein